jgi:hypothetical protein
VDNVYPLFFYIEVFEFVCVLARVHKYFDRQNNQAFLKKNKRAESFHQAQ